jgi:hypothetical protein
MYYYQHYPTWRWINNQLDAEKMMYLLGSQHVSGIIIPIIRRTVQNRQRLWCWPCYHSQKWWSHSQQVHTEPPHLLESATARSVLYTICIWLFIYSPSWFKMHGHVKLKLSYRFRRLLRNLQCEPSKLLLNEIRYSLDRASLYILIIKTNEMHYFSNLF